MSERFERHSYTFALLTLVSRVGGLAREAVLSRVFGAGAVMDAFSFAFLVPNLFRRLFGEGALSAAFVPVYTRLQRDDPETARRLATLTVGMLVALLGAVTLAAEGVLVLCLRHAGDDSALALRLTMIMLPYMPMICAVAILGAMLQVRGRFAPTAASPILLNVCEIAAAVGAPFFFRDDHDRITVVAVSVLVSGLLQVGWMLRSLRGERWWLRGLAAARGPLRTVLVQAAPMVIGLGILQLSTFLDSLIASYPTIVGPTIFGHPYPLEVGAMASVGYAQRLYQFPLGVFGQAIAVAIFPALSRAAHDGAAFRDLIARGLRLTVFIGLPASAGLILVGHPLVKVILEGGEFTADDSRRVAMILTGYASAVWAYSMVQVLTRVFYARGDAWTPLRVSLAMAGLNVALNCTLIWTPLRAAGIAWSTAFCFSFQAVILLQLARRHAQELPGRDVRGSWARSVAATAVMVVAVLAVQRLVPAPATGSWAATVLALAAAVGAGAAAYGAVAFALRMPELRWALGR